MSAIHLNGSTEGMEFEDCPLLKEINAPQISPRDHGCFALVSDEDAASVQQDRAFFEGTYALKRLRRTCVSLLPTATLVALSTIHTTTSRG